MAAERSDKNKDSELEIFIKEYNLQSISAEIYDEGIKINELCLKSDEEIESFAKGLTSNIDQQNNLKNAIYDRKSKINSNNSNEEEKNGNSAAKDQIYVKTLAGNTLTLDIYENTSVKDLKQQIEAKEGISQKQQKLVFAGKGLDNDNAKLTKYNITKGSQLHIILKSKNDCIIL
eukprot:40641_1